MTKSVATSDKTSLSNEQFLGAVFEAQWADAHVTGFGEDPGTLDAQGLRGFWGGRKFGDGRHIDVAHNNYFTISLFDNDPETGRARRRKSLFRATHVIVVDDVLSKVLDTSKLLPPSYRLETSPGNEQWGYILSTPETDAGRVNALLDGMVALGLVADGSDPGMKGVTRYVRLPVGRNTKAKYGSGGFTHVLREWAPAKTFTLEELAIPWGIVLPAPGAAPARGAVAGGGAAGASQIDPMTDELYPHLDRWGLVKGYLGEDKYDLECPWLEDHTGAEDTGAAYLVRSGWFECYHGHCLARKGTVAIRNWADKRLRAETLDVIGVEQGLGYGFDVLTAEDEAAIERIAVAVAPAIVSVSDSWTGSLARDKQGAPKSSVTNAVVALGIGCLLNKHLRWDNATQAIVVVDVQPASPTWAWLGLSGARPVYLDPVTSNPVYPWTDTMLTAVRMHLERWDVCIPKETARDAVNAIAARNSFSSVAAYLRGITWDGISRLDGWLVRHAGAEDTRFNRVALGMWMTGAVARALAPEEQGGKTAKVDTVLVLVGPQGARKSSFVKGLSPVANWHTENSLGDLSSKDATMRISAAWLVDMAEGGSVKANEVEALKQFITSEADNIRLPYGAVVTRIVRRNVFAMTVNPDGAGFLKDGTGNRRFWVVNVEGIDVDLLLQERDQLWAEAVGRYDLGIKWWFDARNASDAAIEAEAAEVAETHRSRTPIEELLRRYLTDVPSLAHTGRLTWAPRLPPLTVMRALPDVFGTLGLTRTSVPDLRDGERAMTTLGWTRVKVRLRNAPVQRGLTVWVAPEGGKALKDDGRSKGKTAIFKRWLADQESTQQIDGSAQSASGAGSDFIDVKEQAA